MIPDVYRTTDNISRWNYDAGRECDLFSLLAGNLHLQPKRLAHRHTCTNVKVKGRAVIRMDYEMIAD